MVTRGTGREGTAGASEPVRISNHLLAHVDLYLQENPLYGDRREVIEAAIREFLQRHAAATVAARRENDPDENKAMLRHATQKVFEASERSAAEKKRGK